MAFKSRLSDIQVIRALAHNEALRGPERDDESDADAFLSELSEDEDPEIDEAWEYMTDLLDAGEIDFDEFSHQMLSAGYSADEINRALPLTPEGRS